MTLPHYYRTERGNLELNHRSIKLTARQRALLLMIDASQLSGLAQQQFQHLATVNNLDILLSHQLISVITQSALNPSTASSSLKEIDPCIAANVDTLTTPARNHKPKELTSLAPAFPVLTDLIQPNFNIDVNATATIDVQQIIISECLYSADAISVPFECLEFEQIKQLMIMSLQQYCGLLASMLIKEIQHTNNITTLRVCQMRWVTTLTETRAPSEQVALWAEQINFSLSENHTQHQNSDVALT